MIEPSLTVGRVPRIANRLAATHNYPTTEGSSQDVKASRSEREFPFQAAQPSILGMKVSIPDIKPSIRAVKTSIPDVKTSIPGV